MKRLLLSLTPFAFTTAPVIAVDYNDEVKPILNEKCFKCHSGPRAKGKLRMDQVSFFSERVGGDDPAIVPGKPEQSLLTIKAGLPPSDGDAMPPPPARSRGAEPMTNAELNIVKQWISEGASFEEGGASAPAPTTAAEPTGEPAMTPELLNWTNSAGNSLQAYFVSFDGTSVKLRKEDGSEFDYPAAQLSAESQELARKLAAQ